MAKAKYCVIVKDQADTRYEKVKSTHRTKRGAQKAARGRRHDKRVTKCGLYVKRGDRIARTLWRKRR